MRCHDCERHDYCPKHGSLRHRERWLREEVALAYSEFTTGDYATAVERLRLIVNGAVGGTRWPE